MTDEELIARLRTMSTNINGWGHGAIAADRIEALVKERDAAYAERDLHIRAAELMEQEIEKLQARAERLEAALREAAHAWATFKGATISDEHFHAVKRLDAALKGDDHE